MLYGASGAGKSSVLLAGVLPHVRRSPHTAAVIHREWQSGRFAEQLKTRCLEAVGEATTEQNRIDAGQPLDDFLLALGEAVGGPILLVLDQFEEYFLYHTTDAEGAAFDVELARAINRDDLDANFLIALREEGLAGMDRFRARIPNLLSNMLRLDHMDLVSAEAAIRKPVEVYNDRDRGRAAPVTIDDELVDAVLAEVRTGQVRVGQQRGVSRSDDDGDTARVEAPFLQLVLERLWEADVEAGRGRMRLKTFKRLGGAQEIVSSHLGRVMQELDDSERATCAGFFDRLVTPSGSKIAYSVPDLVQFAGGNEDDVADVLEKLTSARILRTVEASTDDDAQRVEIFHDVMAPAVLHWVARFAERQEEAAARRQRLTRTLQAGFVLLLVAGFVGYRYYELWLETRPWAYLENLATGSVYALNNDLVSIGRSTGNFKNKIGLKPKTISRKHLLIFDDGTAHELRSTNGTTVNADFLRYGGVRNLEQGDILALAGLAPFRYHTIDYAPLQMWVPSIRAAKPPPDAWALVLDGSAREVTYLTADVYYMSLDAAGRIALAVQEPDKPLMVIRQTARGAITIQDVDDNVKLIAQMKEGDKNFPKYRVNPGTELEDMNSKAQRHDLFEVAYRYRDTPFQLIRIIPDLE